MIFFTVSFSRFTPSRKFSCYSRETAWYVYNLKSMLGRLEFSCYLGFRNRGLLNGVSPFFSETHSWWIMAMAVPLRDGPATTMTIVEFISRRPIFQFWGAPGCRIKCPFYTMEHRENAKIFHLMCHQGPFWCDIGCKTILESNGCGFGWAVPELQKGYFLCGPNGLLPLAHQNRSVTENFGKSLFMVASCACGISKSVLLLVERGFQQLPEQFSRSWTIAKSPWACKGQIAAQPRKGEP